MTLPAKKRQPTELNGSPSLILSIFAGTVSFIVSLFEGARSYVIARSKVTYKRHNPTSERYFNTNAIRKRPLAFDAMLDKRTRVELLA